MLAAPSASTLRDPLAADGTSQKGPEESGSEIRSGSDLISNSHVVSEGNSAEDVASMVLAYVAGAKAFTKGMDKSDEVKLLRLRTRKNEIVIVPGR